MAISTLEAIIKKIRKLTVSSDQITDDEIIDYINSFYLYDFPAEFRSLDLKDVYTFNTIKGVDTYPFDRDHWINVQDPAYVSKRIVRLFQDPQSFYFYNFNSSNHWQQNDVLTTSTGVDTFTGTLGSAPILRSINNNPIVSTQTSNTAVFPAGFPATYPNSNINRIQNFLITANVSNGTTLNVTDDGAGNLIGDIGVGVNTVNYNTGAIDVTFSQVVPSGEDVRVLYNPVQLNIPLSILFFQDQLVLRPVPDQGYICEIVGYRTPSQALLGTDTTTNYSGRPEMKEWWETIAVGASKKIYEDRIDMEGVAMMDKMLVERYNLNYRRTSAQLGKQRIQTLYNSESDSFNSQGPFGWGNN